MTVAIPVWQERVSPVFDAASRLLVVRRHRGRTVERKEFVLTAMPAEALARSVTELGVDVLLCAAISETLRTALERAGVAVETHLCGQVDALIEAFHAGHWRRSEFRMPGCWDPHGPLRLRRSGCRSQGRMQPAGGAKPSQKHA
ncbi:MAG TPA: NifB/NifX family molybdenum-iron cluster-binding protein [Verrucomicrobiota bacterium]|nr:NifB/NifX family molybdenum-iron cluster-binding protein [Verrucomicrobiota bacterium]